VEKVGTKDYKNRAYLSAIESAKFLNISVSELHDLVRKGIIKAFISTSGQMRFKLEDLEEYKNKHNINKRQKDATRTKRRIFEILARGRRTNLIK
jgi:excisionase family DNA binding protein